MDFDTVHAELQQRYAEKASYRRLIGHLMKRWGQPLEEVLIIETNHEMGLMRQGKPVLYRGTNY